MTAPRMATGGTRLGGEESACGRTTFSDRSVRSVPSVHSVHPAYSTARQVTARGLPTSRPPVPASASHTSSHQAGTIVRMGESTDLAARRVWDWQSVWSQAANAAKQQLERARAVGLILGSAAASLSTLGAQMMGWQSALGRILDLIAAISAGLVPLAVSRSGAPALRPAPRASRLSSRSPRRPAPVTEIR